jgi:1,4-dihydroxy-2-naphthoyl-CoA hydrolase
LSGSRCYLWLKLTALRGAGKGDFMDSLELLKQTKLPFAELIGLHFTGAAPDRVTAELVVREELCTNPAVLHGGAMMALADSLGACATILNLSGGRGTTTIESKTNFFAPAPLGSKVLAECSPLHRGRRTMVWQTRITNENGKLLAIVTQTQMVLEPS